MSDWGKGAKNNTIGWGQGACDNTIGWGTFQKDNNSWSGDTDISGCSGADPVPFMYKTEVASGVQTDTGIFRIRKTGGDLTIDWGDGATTTITASQSQNILLHTYNDGTNTDVENPVVKIGAEGETGILTEIYYQASTTTFAADLLEIQQWGTKHAFTSLNFSQSTQMQLTATDALITTQLNGTFSNCTAMTGNSTMNNWDTSNVTSFNATFQGCTNFNQDLYNWDVSNATTHRNMFYANTNFDGNINGWAFTSSTVMTNMFTLSGYNQPVNNWDLTGANKNLFRMFYQATSFSQDISSWDVSKVTSFDSSFENTAMNSDLSSWVLTEATTITRMLLDNTSFNQDIGAMTLGTNLTSVYRLFYRATGLSDSNWTKTIVGWANQVYNNSAPYNVNGSEIATLASLQFDNSADGGANFADAGEARDYLTGATAGWTITGDTRIN
jgi:surface protein